MSYHKCLLINVHAALSILARGLKYYISLYLHPDCVYVCREGADSPEPSLSCQAICQNLVQLAFDT